MMRTLLPVAAALLLSAAAVHAQSQDDVTTRNVTGKNSASNAVVQLNQVDTSHFPAVTIFATVMHDGAPVQNLTATDFRVREDEVDQEPLTVVPKLSPLSAVIALDTSGSMKKALPVAQQAAVDFLHTLAEDDAAQVIGFARTVNILAPLAADKRGAAQSIAATAARGDTALYDALYSSVEALRAKSGRKAIVLLSDGVDDDGYGRQLSKHSVSEVLSLGREVNVPIFTIGLGSEIDEAVLQNVAQASGGQYFNAPTAEDLKQLYAGIGRQLAGQYMISYTSNLPGDGSYHKVQLSWSGQVSVKEYKSPDGVPQASPPVPIAASEQHLKVKKVLSGLPGLGTVSIADIRDQEIEVEPAESSRTVGRITAQNPELEIPAGQYALRVGSLKQYSFEVKPGEKTEIVLGTARASGLSHGKWEIEGADSTATAARLSADKNDIRLPAGRYRVRIGSALCGSFEIAAGQVTELGVSRLRIPNLKKAKLEVEHEDFTATAAVLKSERNQIDLMPGRYKIRVGSLVATYFEIASGETKDLRVGWIKIPDLRSAKVEVEGEDSSAAAGWILPNENELEVPPGQYRLRIAGETTESFEVEGGDVVEIPAGGR